MEGLLIIGIILIFSIVFTIKMMYNYFLNIQLNQTNTNYNIV